jgi:hypothetical protein
MIFLRGLAFITGIILLITSCSKTEVLDNVVMNQAFSLPLGEKSITIDPPAAINLNGNFYYNGRPYRVNSPYFYKVKSIDFNMDSVSKIDWVQKVDFKVKIENSYPVNSYLQVYLLDANLQMTDSVFAGGLMKTGAGEVNILAEPSVTEVAIFESSFEGERLVHLKTTKYLMYKISMETWREDQATLRLTNLSEVKVNLAMRLFLRYNINEL